MPRATIPQAIVLGLCGLHISREGWTCEGEREGHCKNRNNKSLHGVFSFALECDEMFCCQLCGGEAGLLGRFTTPEQYPGPKP